MPGLHTAQPRAQCAKHPVQKRVPWPPEFGDESSLNQLGNALDIIHWQVLSLRPGVVCGEVVGPPITTAISKGKGEYDVA